jgi:hypothetical protein
MELIQKVGANVERGISMSRTRTQIDETILIYFMDAPLPEAERLMRLIRAVLHKRSGGVDKAPRKRRKDQGTPQAEGETK